MGKIIGITGGIASGKSTVTEYLKKQGYQVIDADQVVHELQRAGAPLYEVLISAFGSQILQADGQLNRKKLASMIFENPSLAEQSSQLQNEIIRQELALRRDKLAQTVPLFFMDIPLLFELGYENWFDEIWLVDVSKKSQLERLMARNGLSREEAQKRIASQLSSREKRKKAAVIIDNNGDVEATLRQVQILLDKESR